MPTNMRTKFYIIALSLLCGLPTRQAQAQSFDRELMELSTVVSKSLKDSERRKATVLDFMDLQGNVSELGRFIAEQFSVALVMSRTGFSVMDRANLKSILAEHKLTIAGLVEPENAKKLAQISGVDAIILGTMTALRDEIVVTVKVIATDTAEILGAAKARIPKTKDLEALLGTTISSIPTDPQVGGSGITPFAGRTATSNPKLDLVKLVQVDKNSTQVGELFIRVESVRESSDDSGAYKVVTLALANASSNKPLLASLRNGGRYFAALTDNQGMELQVVSRFHINGIKDGHSELAADEFSQIAPGKPARITLRFPMKSRSIAASTTTYRLEFELAVAADVLDGKLINAKQHNILIDIDGK
jgi:TolB-like protein